MHKLGLLDSFKTAGAILAFEFGAFGVIALIFDKVWIKNNIYIIMMHGVYIFMISFLIWLLLTKQDSDYIKAPKVKIIRDNLILVEAQPWLSVGVLVSVHILEDRVERFVCLGVIANIQQNNLAQVKIQTDDDRIGVDEIMQKIHASDKDSIIIKPGMHLGSLP